MELCVISAKLHLHAYVGLSGVVVAILLAPSSDVAKSRKLSSGNNLTQFVGPML